MATYKTPGVYVKEIPSLPPSVAEVATAVPAFIGYTEKTNRVAGERPEPVRVSSFLDFTEEFGGAPLTSFSVDISGGGIGKITTPTLKFLLAYSIELYFKNGGGPCYIISLGDYSKPTTKPAVDDFEDALEVLKKEDEPTLLLLTDAVNLSTPDYHALCQAALLQCGELQDRFCIFDVLNQKDNGSWLDTTDAVDGFRDGIGINQLKYGAAYYPYLKTVLTYNFDETSVKIDGFSDRIGEHVTATNGIRITYIGTEDLAPQVLIKEADGKSIAFKLDAQTLNITLPKGGNHQPSAVLQAWKDYTGIKGQFDIQLAGSGTTGVGKMTKAQKLKYTDSTKATLGDLKYDETALYNAILNSLRQVRITLPPSSAVAGVYAQVDREQGVWKAPANVSVASIIEPIFKVNNREQEDLNVDANSGKSINVIRTFTGKGVLIWGARTLLGNDNEWRYINVRRLFNLIEESVKKSTNFAVFQPNTIVTWLKVRAMIESYLEDIWQAGALAGQTKEQAFYVRAGLGSTMTEQDILEGRMIVEVGLAAVRPAEFIILKFSHKLQEG